jgi:(R,R)-butanediol dehydrogenase/meso-butanediol dehydrogenase/diacetyl reductase
VNDWPRITAQVSTGRLPVERIITDRLSIDQAASGFERLTAAGADDMKVLVTTSTT